MIKEIIMKYTKEILEIAVKDSHSISEVVRTLGMDRSGGSNRYIKRRILQFDIDMSHFVNCTNCAYLENKVFREKLHFEDVLVLNRVGRREAAKILRRALKESGVEEKCIFCGISDLWCGKKIRLEIDHVNGCGVDNRKENLRFICPNCHSQTDNYKNYKIVKKVKTKNKTTRKTKRPSKEILEKLIFLKPTTHIAKDFQVSDKAVEKWCKFYEIEKPGKGYWLKCENRI